MVLWKRWTEAPAGSIEKLKLLKTDQNWLTSVMGWRCVKVVLCAVEIGACFRGVAAGGIVELAAR